MFINPITSEQQEQVIAASHEYLCRAQAEFTRSLEPIPIKFDLRGRCAGMYKIQHKRRMIRFNPYLFAKYFAENLAVTVPHEVAHYVVDMIYGAHNTRPHGHEWREIMVLFKADAQVTGRYELDGIPVRNYKRHPYVCPCRSHQLTSIRHNRIRRGMRYSCRYCQEELIYSG